MVRQEIQENNQEVIKKCDDVTDRYLDIRLHDKFTGVSENGYGDRMNLGSYNLGVKSNGHGQEGNTSKEESKDISLPSFSDFFNKINSQPAPLHNLNILTNFVLILALCDDIQIYLV